MTSRDTVMLARLLGLLDHEGEGITILRNGGNSSPSDIGWIFSYAAVRMPNPVNTTQLWRHSAAGKSSCLPAVHCTHSFATRHSTCLVHSTHELYTHQLKPSNTCHAPAIIPSVQRSWVLDYLASLLQLHKSHTCSTGWWLHRVWKLPVVQEVF